MKNGPVALLILLASVLLSAQSTETSPAIAGKIYHVGGDVKAPRSISSPAPDQEGMKQQGAGKQTVDRGSVILSLVVADDGSVRSVKVLRGLDKNLDAVAVETVTKWKFTPGTKKGLPVAVQMAVHVDFHLYN